MRAVGLVICLLGPDSVLLAVAPSRRSICDLSSPSGKRTGYPRSTSRLSWSLICPRLARPRTPQQQQHRTQRRRGTPRAASSGFCTLSRQRGGVGVVPQEARGAPKKTPVRWTADDMSPPPSPPGIAARWRPRAGDGAAAAPGWIPGGLVELRDLLVRSQLFERRSLMVEDASIPVRGGHYNVSGLKRSVVALSLVI